MVLACKYVTSKFSQLTSGAEHLINAANLLDDWKVWKGSFQLERLSTALEAARKVKAESAFMIDVLGSGAQEAKKKYRPENWIIEVDKLVTTMDPRPMRSVKRRDASVL